MPDIGGATDWINGKPHPEELRGHAVLVYFWSSSCHLCHEKLPELATWREQFSQQGLRMIAIHVPQSPADLEVERVKEHAQQIGITDPCGLDNQFKVTEAFDAQYLPGLFLFDEQGLLRARTGGASALEILRPMLERRMAA
jgi:thiol-disulfide isomerase/thioredoxin